MSESLIALPYADWTATGSLPSASDSNRRIKALTWKPAVKKFEVTGNLAELEEEVRRHGKAAVEWADSRKDASAQAKPRASRAHGEALLRIADILRASL